MGGTAAPCLWLQPACHYDVSVAYQCRLQIYLSGTRLWPHLGLNLAPAHPSASKILLWCSGHNLYFYYDTMTPHGRAFVHTIQVASSIEELLGSTCRHASVHLRYKSAEPERCFVIVRALLLCLHLSGRKLAGFKCCGWTTLLMALVNAPFNKLSNY